MAEKKISVIVQMGVKGGKSIVSAVKTLTKIGQLPFKAIGGGFSKIFGALTSLKGVVAGFAVGKLAASVVSITSKFEQWGVAFKTLTGSAQKAGLILKQIKDFAAKTPFELPGLVENSKKLLAFGFGVDSIIPTMRSLGDIAAGVGKDKLPTLVNSLGKIKVKGRASLEELNMMLEAGVPILDELAVGFDVSKQELFKMVSAGKVGFEDVNSAIQRMTSEGSKFGGLMAAQSQTLGGIWSNATDNIIQGALALGEKAMPAFKKIATAVRDFTGSDQFTVWAENIGSAVAKINEHWSTISTIIAFTKKQISFKLNDIKTNFKIWSRSLQEIMSRPFQFQTYKKIFNLLITKIGKMTHDIIWLTKNIAISGNNAIDAFVRSAYETSKGAASTFDSDITKIQKKGALERLAIEAQYIKDLKLIDDDEKKRKQAIIDAEILAEEKKLFGDDALQGMNAGYYSGLLQQAKDSTTNLKGQTDQQKEDYGLHLNDMRLLGAGFVTDFEGTIGGLVNNVVNGEKGIASSIQEGLTEMLGKDVASFIGGATGEVIASGIMSIITTLLGGSKTVNEWAEEAFDKMVRNTNKALEDIGRQKSLVEQQVDILEALKDTGKTTLDKEYALLLGETIGASIDAVLKTKFEQIGLLETEELDEYYTSIANQKEAINEVTESIAKNKIILDRIADPNDDLSDLGGRGGVTGINEDSVKIAGDYLSTKLEGLTNALDKYEKTQLKPEIFEEALDQLNLQQRITNIKDKASGLDFSGVTGMANGGIVGGSYTTGDRMVRRLNSREGVFTLNDQKELFNIAKGGGTGSGEVVKKLDEINKSLKDTAIIELKAAGMDSFVKANYRRQTRMQRTGQLSSRGSN